jgi:hypothetical protein
MSDTRKTPTVAVIDGHESLTARITRVLGKLPDTAVERRHYAHITTPDRFPLGNLSGLEPMNRAMRRRMGK